MSSYNTRNTSPEDSIEEAKTAIEVAIHAIGKAESSNRTVSNFQILPTLSLTGQSLQQILHKLKLATEHGTEAKAGNFQANCAALRRNVL